MVDFKKITEGLKDLVPGMNPGSEDSEDRGRQIKRRNDDDDDDDDDKRWKSERGDRRDDDDDDDDDD
jgi:hypothetical protein